MIVMPSVQQRIFGQSSGRDDPNDLSGYDCSRTAFSRLGGVFGLFANRYPESLLDQLVQVTRRGMDGNAAHRYIPAFRPSALRQRNAQCFGRRDGIVEEHLVEVAHAVK